MAANWNNPALTSLYVDFLAELKERDVDSVTMFPGTNIPVGAKRWNPPTSTFQVWDGAVWNNLVLAGAGGGTGSGSFPALGTMAAQNANAVAITGGTITGVNLNANDITSGIVALNRGGTGASLALGAVGSFLQVVGAAVAFGVNGAALQALNATQLTAGNIPVARMPLSGNWVINAALSITGSSVVIGAPAGGAMGAGTINAQNLFINGVALATGAGIPSGLMAYFSNACPAGWTYVAAADLRIVRVTANGFGAVGGNTQHTHGFSVPAGGGGGVNSGGPDTANSSNGAPAGTAKSFDAGSSFGGFLINNGAEQHSHPIPHTHNFNVPEYPGHAGGTDLGGDWPPIIDFVLCSKN